MLTPGESMVPARLLDDLRVSMKALLEQNVNAWHEVERLHELLREAERKNAWMAASLAQLPPFEPRPAAHINEQTTAPPSLDPASDIPC